jgi:protein-arginine kinase
MSERTAYERTHDSVILIDEIIGGLVITGQDDDVSAMRRNVDHLKIKINDPDFTAEQKAVLQVAINDGEAWLLAHE